MGAIDFRARGAAFFVSLSAEGARCANSGNATFAALAAFGAFDVADLGAIDFRPDLDAIDLAGKDFDGPFVALDFGPFGAGAATSSRSSGSTVEVEMDA